MKINELILFKAIYPRGRDQVHEEVDSKGETKKVGENKIQPNEDNVKRIKEFIELNGHPPQPIKYNKNHLKNCRCGQQGYHVIDGTHTYTALDELEWKEIPAKYLEAIDIPVEEEMVYAIHYNVSHGLPLSRLEVKACLANMMDDKGELKYGTIKKLVKLWNIPEGTLKQWIGDIRGGPRTIERTASDSSDINISDDKERDKLKQELEETREELTKVKADARQAFWEMICETHQEAIKGCKKCGK